MIKPSKKNLPIDSNRKKHLCPKNTTQQQTVTRSYASAPRENKQRKSVQLLATCENTFSNLGDEFEL